MALVRPEFEQVYGPAMLVPGFEMKASLAAEGIASTLSLGWDAGDDWDQWDDLDSTNDTEPATSRVFEDVVRREHWSQAIVNLSPRDTRASRGRFLRAAQTADVDGASSITDFGDVLDLVLRRLAAAPHRPPRTVVNGALDEVAALLQDDEAKRVLRRVRAALLRLTDRVFTAPLESSGGHWASIAARQLSSLWSSAAHESPLARPRGQPAPARLQVILTKSCPRTGPPTAPLLAATV